LVLLCAACGSGGASEPPVTSYDPAVTAKLQFAVGMATIASNNGANVACGLNTVVTLRQSDGLSGTLYNVPQIIGPSNFNVLISTQTGNEVQFAGADLGTNHITWSTLNQSQWTGPPRGLKAATTGVFGYGFCPCNSDAGPVNGTPPLYEAFNLPVYGNNLERFYGGPPAFPGIDPSVAALGFQGYSLGFADFAVKPVLGTYHLYAAVPPAFTTPANPTPSPDPNGTPTPAPGVLAANAQLASLTPLPALATPSLRPDGKGGGTVHVSVPAGVHEAMVVIRALGNSGIGVCLLSHTSDAFYTVITHARGAQGLLLPDSIGPKTQSGKPTPSICPKGTYQLYAVGADYPIFEAAYPQNLAQLPTIAAANGQADVTTSDIATGAYP
ncbi:MAG: hypothetical protein JO092_08885, partial [Candidatus Eremiobacteraeota bacterium]|nr:hypothetical protein [Candidatus Eremiobacteraeota bacterium]